MAKDKGKQPEYNTGTKGVAQPLMSTGSTEAGLDWNTDGSKLAAKPKAGEQLMGEDGTTGRLR
ncbi:hypothetical protein [Peribacillus kribbensis]|uniref:hypothetical protein n=1 Tax=Peribacillus kribbensis TaxID=356658 RepID=UPI000415A7C2|nr:hypothetical protein [Peribacillus kribbensis]